MLTDDIGIAKVALVRPPLFTWKLFGIIIGIVFAVLEPIFLLGLLADQQLIRQFGLAGAIGFATAVSVASALIYGSIFYFPWLYVRKAKFYSENIDRLSKSSEELQGSLEQDFVTNLVRINFKYIDAYYLQTRIQADKSFTFTLFAALVSLALIVTGIALTFFDKTNSAAISAGAGVLGQFISAVFFYLYNQTVAKMADYHRKLVFTQNIGLALKISDGLPVEEKTKAQVALITTLSTNINQYLSA